MGKRQSKAEIRHELEQQIANYMRDGGQIHKIRPGLSGLADGEVLHPQFSDGKPAQPRTPAMDILATIDARRAQTRNAAKNGGKGATRKPKPRKKMLYDDFGEPLREVWVDE